MNWSLIFRLSLFGLFMAFATITIIPVRIEPICWAVIFLICAYIIAMRCKSKFFLHGLLVSLVNSVWITAAHFIFFDQYMNHHQNMATVNAQFPAGTNPRFLMLAFGPLYGAASGLLLGLLAFAGSRLVKRL